MCIMQHSRDSNWPHSVLTNYLQHSGHVAFVGLILSQSVKMRAKLPAKRGLMTSK